jgi:hypothetical protein
VTTETLLGVATPWIVVGGAEPPLLVDVEAGLSDPEQPISKPAAAIAQAIP